MIDYILTRTNRKTIALYVRNGCVEVRAPLKTCKSEIDCFIISKKKWIRDKLVQSQKQMEVRKNFSLNYGDFVTCQGKEYPVSASVGECIGFDGESFYMPPNLPPKQIKSTCIQIYRLQAKRILIPKTLCFAEKMSVSPSDIKINGAKTRWGSCSAKKSLNFSWRLIMAEDSVIDYVVVHELAHISEMNHSERFWAIVGLVMPDYRERIKCLKELQLHLNGEDWDT